MVVSFFLSLLQPENIILLFCVLFILRYMVFTTLENLFTAQRFNRREVIVSDLITMFSYTVIIFPIAQYISNRVGVEGSFLSYLSTMPIIFRILLYYVVADFFHYWIHRLMHEPFLWKVHMWHHSVNHMSWMGGFRATVFDAVLVNLAFIFAWPILGDIGYGQILTILVINVLINDWTHLNVRFRSPLLEKIIVMPRYHHIHHSIDTKHYSKNFSGIFSVWDRMFGTYSNPDAEQKELTFGLHKKVSTIRLVTGV